MQTNSKSNPDPTFSQNRTPDHSLPIGLGGVLLDRGHYNAITDVPGVKVGMSEKKMGDDPS